MLSSSQLDSPERMPAQGKLPDSGWGEVDNNLYRRFFSSSTRQMTGPLRSLATLNVNAIHAMSTPPTVFVAESVIIAPLGIVSIIRRT